MAQQTPRQSAEQGPLILVVDDELFFREAIGDILGNAGMRCIARDTGEGALAAAVDTDVGVVVLDVRLPDVDGITVLERLRELRPSLRVIMLSASTDQDIVLDALRKGACDYLAKPLHDEELILAVRRALEGYTVARDWTRLRERLARLVARMEELASLASDKQGDERLLLVCEGVTQAASEVLASRKTSLLLADSDDPSLRVAAAVGRDMKPEEFDPVAPGERVAGHVFAEGAAVVVADATRDDRFDDDRCSPDRYESASFVAAPLFEGAVPVGVLCATDREAGGAFTDEDLSLLRLLALQAADLLAAPAPEVSVTDVGASEDSEVEFAADADVLAMGGIRDGAHAADVLPKAEYGEDLDRDAELAREICQAIVDEVDPARMIQTALRSLSALLPAAPVSIFLADPNVGELRREGECDGGVNPDREHLPRNAGLTGTVLQTGHVVATRDPSADPRFDPEVDTPLGGTPRPFLCIPLRLRGKVVGVFRAFLQEGAEPSARTAEVLGASLSAAVRNALLYRSLIDAIEEVAEARRSARR